MKVVIRDNLNTAKTSRQLTQSTEDVTLGIDKGLALFLGDVLGQLGHVVADQVLQLEHHLLAAQDRSLAPSLEGLLRGLHCRFHFTLGALGDTRDYLVGGRIVQVNPFGGLRVHELTVDEHLGRWDRGGTVAALQSIAVLKSGE